MYLYRTQRKDIIQSVSRVHVEHGTPGMGSHWLLCEHPSGSRPDSYSILVPRYSRLAHGILELRQVVMRTLYYLALRQLVQTIDML